MRSCLDWVRGARSRVPAPHTIKAPVEASSTEVGICREIVQEKIEFRASDRVRSPVQLSKLKRLLRHSFLVMKAAAQANRTGDDDGADN